MIYAERFLTYVLPRTGLLLVLVALSVGLTGCYTQLQVAEETRGTRASQKQAYADEYRREYRQEYRRETRRNVTEYRYSVRLYDRWHHDPFFFDPWFGPYSSRFSLSIHFGSPYHHWSWHRPHWWYHDPFFFRPYRPFFSGIYRSPFYRNPYYGSGFYSPVPSYASNDRNYRPRGGTIGHSTSDGGRRGASARGNRAARGSDAKTFARGESSRGRIGRRSDDRARGARGSSTGDRWTRTDRTRTENGRVGRRSSRGSRAGRSSRSSNRSSGGTRTGRSSNKSGSKARGSGHSSSSGNGSGRSSRGSSSSGEKGSRSSREDEGSNDDSNKRRLQSAIFRTVPNRIEVDDRYEDELRRLEERYTVRNGFIGPRSSRGFRDYSHSSRDYSAPDWKRSRTTSFQKSGSGRKVTGSNSRESKARSSSTSRSSRSSRSNDEGSNRRSRNGGGR